MDDKTKAMLKAVEEKANQAAQKWLKENGPDIERKIYALLDQRLETIVAKLMGFDNDWGDWRLDHCNGRAGESLAGDWLRKRAGQAAYAWLDQQAKKLPNLPAGTVKALQKEYIGYFGSEAQQLLRKKAIMDAEAEVERIFTGWMDEADSTPFDEDI